MEAVQGGIQHLAPSQRLPDNVELGPAPQADGAPPGRITVAEYLGRWLQQYAKPNTAPKTFRRYEEAVRLHLVPAIGAIPLTKLRPLHIQQCYASILAKGLSSRTALHCHRILREALQHAVKLQLLVRNPADAVEPPRPERFEVKPPSCDQLRSLLDAADATPYGALVHTAIMTGLRQGELLGLRWQDVDMERGVLYVQQTVQWLPRQGFIFRQPKTPRSRRAVALTPETVRRLRQHRLHQLEEPTDPSNLRRAWLGIVRAAGLDHVRFHDLRHAHATLLLQQGTHPKVVSERLGHSGVGITLDTYSHVLPGLQSQAVAQLDGLLNTDVG